MATARWRRARAAEGLVTARATELLSTPEGRRLRREREQLGARLAGAVEAESAARARAHQSGDPGGYYREHQPRHEEGITRARAALADFDAANPRLLAAIKAEKTASARRGWQS